MDNSNDSSARGDEGGEIDMKDDAAPDLDLRSEDWIFQVDDGCDDVEEAGSCPSEQSEFSMCEDEEDFEEMHGPLIHPFHYDVMDVPHALLQSSLVRGERTVTIQIHRDGPEVVEAHIMREPRSSPRPAGPLWKEGTISRSRNRQEGPEGATRETINGDAFLQRKQASAEVQRVLSDQAFVEKILLELEGVEISNLCIQKSLAELCLKPSPDSSRLL